MRRAVVVTPWIVCTLLLTAPGCTPESTPDAGMSDAEAVADVVTVPVVRAWGEVTVSQSTVSRAAGSGTRINAEFWQTEAHRRVGCTRPVIGPCRILACNDRNEGTLPLPMPAGTLTVSGGAAGPLTVMPQPYGHYTADRFMPDPYFAPGNTLSVSASGDMVPAFEAQVTFPPRVVPTYPAPFQDVGFSARQEFVATWRPVASTVEIRLERHTPRVDARCTFDGMAGTGAIPGAVIEVLLAEGGAVEGTVDIGTVDEREVMAGDFPVRVRAESGAYGSITRFSR